MNFLRPKPQVLVAGAGPVGLFAALSLARRGIRVRIIDEEWRGSTHSYALALHPRSLELLDALGLATAALEKARTLRTVGLYDRSGRHAELKLDALSSRHPMVAVLAQVDLEDLLIGALEKEKVQVGWNHRLARISPEGSHVRATIHTLGKESLGYVVATEGTVVESSSEVDVPFLIGADGHNSLVRTQLGIQFERVRPADNFAVFEFEATGSLPDEMCILLDESSTNVLWPMPGNRYRWSFQLLDGQVAEQSREKDHLLMSLADSKRRALDVDRLREFIEQRAPWFDAKIERVVWSMPVRFAYRMAKAFGGSRAFLAGDAGHMTGPVGVQSMNVGLSEVAELCDAIAGVLEGKKNLDALAIYSTRRVSEWNHLLGVGAPGLSASENAEAWTRARAERLTACIPASGEHLRALVSQVGLQPNVS